MLKDKNTPLGLSVRSLFPVFEGTEGSKDSKAKPLAYLDTAASSQKPLCVINRISEYLKYEHANIHRGAYSLSANATLAYEQTRADLAQYIGAAKEQEVVFTKSATEAFNLLAHCLCENFTKDDSIVISTLEHHSNIVPWQMQQKQKRAHIHFIDLEASTKLNEEHFKELLTKHKPKIVTLTAAANAFGTIVPIKKYAALAHEVGAIVVVDAAQSLVHQKVDVQDLDVDFLVGTGHKMYGPTGVGFLYGKFDLLEQLSPYQGGGDMIEVVTTSGFTQAEVPRRFEAGTPPIAEVIGLCEALKFVEGFDMDEITAHENKVVQYGYSLLANEPGVTVYAPENIGSSEHASILSFTVDGVHPHDLATIADSYNVQVRAGHHCAMPALAALKVAATTRASVGIYSAEQDFDQLIESIRYAKKLMS